MNAQEKDRLKKLEEMCQAYWDLLMVEKDKQRHEVLLWTWCTLDQSLRYLKGNERIWEDYWQSELEITKDICKRRVNNE